MFVSKDLLVPGAKIAHNLAMLPTNVPVEVRPTEALDVAVFIGTIVSQQQDRIVEDGIFLKLYSQVLINSGEGLISKVLVSLVHAVGKDDIVGLCATVGASFGFVQCPQPKSADVTRLVVTGRDGGMLDGACTYEADFALGIFLLCCLHLYFTILHT